MITYKQHLIPGLLFILLLGTVFVWSLVLAESPSHVLTVAFLNVGQGDAIYIETPSGNQALIDGGKGRAVIRELGSIMNGHDRTIDSIIATHPDLDHIGGLPEVFERYDIGMFIEPGVFDDGADNEALHEAVTEEHRIPIRARAGTTLMLDDGVALTFLFPESDVTAFETNTASIVARLTYGKTSFLFTGDSPQAIERYLVTRYGTGLASDVLKLGHHGSDTSSSAEFLSAVSPVHAIISAGCDNSYGHPHPATLERLKQFEVTAHSTCTDGMLIFKSDGSTVAFER